MSYTPRILSGKKCLQYLRQAVFGVAGGDVAHLRLDVVRGVAHCHAVAGVAQHVEVVVVVAEGDDFVCADAPNAFP